MRTIRIEINNKTIKLSGVEVDCLSKDEAKVLPMSVRNCGSEWWLKTIVGRKKIMTVGNHGSIGMLGNSPLDICSIRPVLRFMNNPAEFSHNYRFKAFGMSWLIVSPQYALCEHTIGKNIFQRNTGAALSWENSDLKAKIEKWFNDLADKETAEELSQGDETVKSEADKYAEEKWLEKIYEDAGPIELDAVLENVDFNPRKDEAPEESDDGKTARLYPSLEPVELTVTGISCLTESQARQLTVDTRGINKKWWLRSVGTSAESVMIVDNNGAVAVIGRKVFKPQWVRPVIMIDYDKETDLRGKTFRLYDQDWLVFRRDMALCKDVIGEHIYRGRKGVDGNTEWESSELKQWLEFWLNIKQTGKGSLDDFVAKDEADETIDETAEESTEETAAPVLHVEKTEEEKAELLRLSFVVLQVRHQRQAQDHRQIQKFLRDCEELKIKEQEAVAIYEARLAAKNAVDAEEEPEWPVLNEFIDMDAPAETEEPVSESEESVLTDAEENEMDSTNDSLDEDEDVLSALFI